MSISGALSAEMRTEIERKSIQQKVEGASAKRRPMTADQEPPPLELSILISLHLPVLVPQNRFLPDMLAAIQVT